MFHYLNLKSVFLWKIWGEGGWIHTANFKLRIVSYPIAAITLIFKGEWKDLFDKIQRKALIPLVRRYQNTRNVGS